MPAEWGRHERCWMAWPVSSQAFGNRLEEARHAFNTVAQTISRFEPVTVIANPDIAPTVAKSCGPAIDILPMTIDDSWTRDTGPTFVVNQNGEVAGVDWIFNGWGGIFPRCENDARMAKRILKHLEMKRYGAPLVLEGGAVHVDGRGTFLGVESAICDPNRNPDLTREEIESRLARFIGVHHFIWLRRGLENDETNGHVDNVACFARPGVVLLNASYDPSDKNHEIYRENRDILEKSVDNEGRPLKIVEVEQPSRREGKNGRLTLSYINFYMANNAIIMPSFSETNKDEKALKTVKEVFPDRFVVQLPALDIVYGGGGIHCITQQQPSGKPFPPDGMHG